jgi:hypothetical protein
LPSPASPPSSTTCPPLRPRIASSEPSDSDRQTARSSSAGTSCVATAIYVSNPSVAWFCEPVAPTSVPRKRKPVPAGKGVPLPAGSSRSDDNAALRPPPARSD